MANIVIADDDASGLQFARLVLESEGHSVRTAPNGLEGLLAVEAAVPDLVVSDLQMPEMDGLEATRRIRLSEERYIPIIAVTASALDGDRERCIEVGMDDFLSKPVRAGELGTAIRRCLSIPEPSDDG